MTTANMTGANTSVDPAAQLSIGNFINNTSADSADGRRTALLDPSTGQPLGVAALSGEEDCRRASEAALAAFEKWGRTTPAERARAINRIADTIEERAAEFIELESRNTGKPLTWLTNEEMPAMLDHIRYFGGVARTLGGISAGDYITGYVSYMRREPLGVCAQVTPWNYPMLMAVWKWAPALAAGNTVVLKPAETTPATTALMAECMAEHLPPGVFNVVCGDRDTGRRLIDQKIPAMVSITGSVRGGMEVAASAAKTLKRVHMELGGKAPVLVFADSDLAWAADQICAAGLLNAGQDCAAATRILVERPALDEFARLLVARARSARFGAPSEPDVEYGPLNSAGQRDRVVDLLSRTPEHAETLTGGSPSDLNGGFFFEPTVITGLRQQDELIQTEIFGPVMTLQAFNDDATAIRLANDVNFGLASSVWTNDHARVERVTAELDFGTVWVNCHLLNPAELPNAGFKHSGDGSDLSVYGLDNYTRLKHVMSNHEAR